jgi:hypothetical protein
MIQRIQSLFLAAAVVISVLLFFVPFSEKSGADDQSGTNVTRQLVLNPADSGADESPDQNAYVVNYMLLILNLLVFSACGYAVFLFGNRIAQMKLCALAGLLALLNVVAIFYFTDKLPGDARPHYLTGLYLAAAQVFLILAARRAIKKDEMLVRSADRIR